MNGLPGCLLRKGLHSLIQWKKIIYGLSQYPSWIHPEKFPGENLFHKITPQRKTFGFFTSPTKMHNLIHPRKSKPIIDSPQWIFGFHSMSFYITPVLLLILIGVWQYLIGITTVWGINYINFLIMIGWSFFICFCLFFIVSWELDVFYSNIL